MSNETWILLGTAASIGFVHTILGPDHYLPFIVLSRARGWKTAKTAWITTLCGIGHVLSSIVLGFLGIALGIAVFRLESVEAVRGDIAAWLLLGFGLAYFVWGVRRAIRNRPHEHVHLHADGSEHTHPHTHAGEHAHVHPAKAKSLTPWILFTIFVFGPCEPLIPLLMYPAARGSVGRVVLVALVFGTVTVGTMLTVVLTFQRGLSRVPLRGMERYSHALAGLAIFLSGGAIKFLGL
jgi:sulfite exporter TauE/SafE